MEGQKMKIDSISKEKDNKELLLRAKERFFDFQSLANSTSSMGAVQGEFNALEVIYQIKINELDADKKKLFEEARNDFLKKAYGRYNPNDIQNIVFILHMKVKKLFEEVLSDVI